MNEGRWSKPGWQGDIIAIIAGTLLPFSLAPYDFWFLGILAPAILAFLLKGLNAKPTFWRSFLFGAGMFGKGASWVYVSIHDFGYTTAPLALVMTGLFVCALAVTFALPFFIYARFFNSRLLSNSCARISIHDSQDTPYNTAKHVFGFAAVWVLGEWSRSWFLTGFPWLYLGYAHADTWLAGWAPIIGVYGIGFICVLTGTTLSETIQRLLLRHKQGERWFSLSRSHSVALSFTACLWLIGFSALISDDQYEETPKISVAIVQPNISLEMKWNPLKLNKVLDILREETQNHWDKDLIIWPEAAIPIMYNDAQYFLDEIEKIANATSSGLITGILYDDKKPMTFFNSIIGLGRADGIYFKQRLVPFGEYVPMEKWLRGLIDFFNLPNSIIFPGPQNQEILQFDNYKIAPSICYEIVYPDLVAQLAREADLLITISNDAWFGDSIGPIQHFQMAQMRALENQRYVIRGTNTGISGIIAPSGKVTVASRQFQRETITQMDVRLINKKTWFSVWGSTPLVVFCGLILAALLIAQRRLNQLARLATATA